jgi:hypothetical protein
MLEGSFVKGYVWRVDGGGTFCLGVCVEGKMVWGLIVKEHAWKGRWRRNVLSRDMGWKGGKWREN